MQPNTVLVRFGELTLKGRNRSRFERSVLTHIQSLLAHVEHLTYSTEFGRIYIENIGPSYDQVSEALSKVFGIRSYSPVYVTSWELNDIQEMAVTLVKSEAVAPSTFKVTTRRANKSFPHDTHAVNHLIGSYVLRACPHLSVDVHQPDLTIHVEIRKDKVFLYSRTEPGTGGFPLGTNGKGMLLLSGGIDSPVAGWYALRKGMLIEAIHFHSYPYTSERAKQKVIDLARKLSEYAGEIKLHLVPFTEIQTQLNSARTGNNIVTLMRRAMFRIAERLAEQNGALALVTGESLGQVASQTLPSMNAIGRVVEMPILQPLVMMDKNDIIQTAERIGTYNISILPYDDCCTLFLPKSPTTNPSLRVLQRMEQSFDFMPELIEDAIKNTEKITVKPQSEPEDQSLHLF